LDRIVIVSIAGALGALARFGLQSLAIDMLGRPTVLGTLIVNLSGGFLLGLLVGFAENRLDEPSYLRLGGGIGFLGAYTTFSTLMFEAVDRLERGDILLVLAYLLTSIAFGLLVTYVGLILGRSI
jgi:CrcB protein